MHRRARGPCFPAPPGSTHTLSTLTPPPPQALKAMAYRSWETRVIDATWPVEEGPAGMVAALERICEEAGAPFNSFLGEGGSGRASLDQTAPDFAVLGGGRAGGSARACPTCLHGAAAPPPPHTHTHTSPPIPPIPPRPPTPSTTAWTLCACQTGRRAPTASRSRRCWPWAPCTTTWSTTRCARAWACCWRRCV